MLCDGVWQQLHETDLTACTTVKPNSEQPIYTHIFIIIIITMIIANKNPTRRRFGRGLKMAINPNPVRHPAQRKI